MSAIRNMKPLYIWCRCHQVQLCCKSGLANPAVQDCVENVKAVATQLIKSSTAHNKFLECAEAVGFEVVTTKVVRALQKTAEQRITRSPRDRETTTSFFKISGVIVALLLFATDYSGMPRRGRRRGPKRWCFCT